MFDWLNDWLHLYLTPVGQDLNMLLCLQPVEWCYYLSFTTLFSFLLLLLKGWRYMCVYQQPTYIPGSRERFCHFQQYSEQPECLSEFFTSGKCDTLSILYVYHSILSYVFHTLFCISPSCHLSFQYQKSDCQALSPMRLCQNWRAVTQMVVHHSPW